MGHKENNHYFAKSAETIRYEVEILKTYTERIIYNATRIRCQMGYSQKDLANLIDSDIQLIRRLETGVSNRKKEYNPRILTLIKIAEACKVQVSEFFKNIPPKNE